MLSLLVHPIQCVPISTPSNDNDESTLNKESNFHVTKTEWVDIEYRQSGLKGPHGPDEVETCLWVRKPPRHHGLVTLPSVGILPACTWCIMRFPSLISVSIRKSRRF